MAVNTQQEYPHIGCRSRSYLQYYWIWINNYSAQCTLFRDQTKSMLPSATVYNFNLVSVHVMFILKDCSRCLYLSDCILQGSKISKDNILISHSMFVFYNFHRLQHYLFHIDSGLMTLLCSMSVTLTKSKCSAVCYMYGHLPRPTPVYCG